MRKYIIMGVQGCGKGTQARRLAEGYDLVHISVGDILRWNVQHHTKIGAQVRRIMTSGALVDDDLVEGTRVLVLCMRMNTSAHLTRSGTYICSRVATTISMRIASHI